MRRLTMLAALAVAGIVVAPAAEARIVHAHDAQGRSITFDVRAPGVDVAFYRRLLSDAAHGDEISRVRILIVAPVAVGRHCRTVHVAGCYARGTMVVPAGRDSPAAHTLLHEYGHHLDRWRGVLGVTEPNGTSHWWAARGMERLERLGRVGRDYSRGWSHSIAEIFAEDYAYLNLDLPYQIRWLSPPGPLVRAGLRQDVAGLPAASRPPPPVVIERSGVLGAGATESVRFGLLGPGRRVTFSVALAGSPGTDTAAQLVLSCAGRRVVADVSARQRSATIDERGLGPDFDCRATVVSSSAAPARFVLRVRLAVGRAGRLSA